VAERPLLHRIHNPHDYECGCDPDCWCRRTRIGRLVKWWFPARWFGIRHKNGFFSGMSFSKIRAWKRDREQKGLYPASAVDRNAVVVQPRYESIVRLGPGRWGMTVRRADGSRAVHELGGRARLERGF
jgi:hypothetical protein